MLIRTAPLWLLLAGCGGCDGSSEAGLQARTSRVWGLAKQQEAERQRAEEPIDASSLDVDRAALDRVRGLTFPEVVARLGFVRYQGKARFSLARNDHELEVVEDTTIEHGLDGGWRVVQRDGKGVLLREKLHHHGLFYVRNGPGQLRAQGVADAPGEATLDEAFEPLSTFTAWYGERLAVRRAGSGTRGGQRTIEYQWRLGPGPDRLDDPNRPGKGVRPVALSGKISVDEGTGVPLMATLRGKLEIEPPPGGSEWGSLELALDMTIEPIEGRPILPSEAVPELSHRSMDDDPLGFLRGGTRTATIIGGPGRP